MSIPPERIIDTKTLYDGHIVRFRVNTVELPDGRTAKRVVVETPGAVAIVAVTQDRRVHLVRQFRAGAGDFLLEIPAGTLERGEEPITAAPRELAEETGDRAEHWQHLTSIYTTPGICDEVIHIFLATGLSRGHTHLDADEFIEPVTLPLEEAVAMAKNGQIRDAKSVIGLLLTAEYLL